MKLPRIAIENYQFMLIVIIGLVFLGLGSIATMPRSEDPGLKASKAHVIAIYPGATSDDMEKLITEPIEEKLNELEDVDLIKSTIENGLSWTNISFDFNSDLDERIAELKEVMNTLRAELPDGIVFFEVKREELSNVNVIQLALVSDEESYSDLRKKADKIKDEIERISVVKKVQIHGNPDEIISVEPDLEKLASLNISPNDIVNAVKSYNANIPGGSINIGTKKFDIQTSGSFETLEDIKFTIISARSGSPVYLKDVANVFYSYKDHNYKTRYNSDRCILITAQQKENTDIFTLTSGVKKIVSKWQTLLSGNDTKLVFAFDQSIGVEKRISSFLMNLAEGIFLVGVVVFFAVGYRASGIIMFAIPLSFIIGLGFVDMSGFGIQQMTIAGLVIALGLLVDNAIVVTENIHVFLKKGHKGTDAAIKATSQVAWPIVSSTATTILAFLPMMMMANESGDFIRSMPTTVIFTLTASLIVSLTLTPFLSAKFFAKKNIEKENKFQIILKKVIEVEYRKKLLWSIQNGKRILIIAIVALIGSLIFAKLFIGVSMFPKAEKLQFIVNLELPKGTNLLETNKGTRFIEKALEEEPAIRYYFTNLGQQNPMIHYAHRGKEESAYYAQFLVEVDENKGNVSGVVTSLTKKFNAFVAGKIEITEFSQGPGQEAPIAIKIIGDNLSELTQLASQIETLISSTDGTTNITNPSNIPVTDLYVNINKEKALMLGVPIHVIDQTIRVAIAGMPISVFRDKEGDKYDVILRLPVNNAPKLEDFSRIYVESVMGKQIPLNHFVSIEFKSGQSKIEHYNLERTITITSDVVGKTTAEVTNEVIKKLETFHWPNGYRYHVGGEKEAQQKAFGGMITATILAMLFIYGVLVLQFKSFSQPLIVFSAIPLAIIGSVIALFLAGYTFSFTAFVGLTSLVGIVVNNSILLVEYSNELRKEGKSLIESIKEAAEARFTPIILTTATTIGGLLPLTLQGGSMWAPMGWTIIGGLIASTFLTLLVVPVLYKLYTR